MTRKIIFFIIGWVSSAAPRVEFLTVPERVLSVLAFWLAGVRLELIVPEELVLSLFPEEPVRATTKPEVEILALLVSVLAREMGVELAEQAVSTLPVSALAFWLRASDE
jgi:hypothetical protein